MISHQNQWINFKWFFVFIADTVDLLVDINNNQFIPVCNLLFALDKSTWISMDSNRVLRSNCFFQLVGTGSNTIYCHDWNVPKKGIAILNDLTQSVFWITVFFSLFLDTADIYCNSKFDVLDLVVCTWINIPNYIGDIWSIHLHG